MAVKKISMNLSDKGLANADYLKAALGCSFTLTTLRALALLRSVVEAQKNGGKILIFASDTDTEPERVIFF